MQCHPDMNNVEPSAGAHLARRAFRARGSALAAASLALAFATAGCSEDPLEPEEEVPFLFRTDGEAHAKIVVRVGGRPVEGALVTVRQTPDAGGGVLGLVRSDDTGLAEAVLALSAGEQEVELVVRQPGARGRWTDEEAQSQLGAFAPALVRRVDVSELERLELDLEEVAR